jgi:triacylglycerol lipase
MLQIIILIGLAVELCVYALVGMWLARRGYGWQTIVPILALAAVIWRVLFALPSTVLAAVLRRRVKTTRTSSGKALAAFAKELDARALCYTITQPFHNLLMREPERRVEGLPILLVHGYFSNRGMWWSFRRRLMASGLGPVYAVNLEPIWGSIDTMVPGLAAKLDEIVAATGKRDLVIVAHSMGGLVTRAYMATRAAHIAEGSARSAHIRALVTIGSPHHGTVMSSAGVGQCVREMSVNSAWLAALEKAELGADAVRPRTVSIYSRNDDLVVPPESACLDWAENVPFEGVGHVGTLFSRPVAERVIAELKAISASGPEQSESAAGIASPVAEPTVQ